MRKAQKKRFVQSKFYIQVEEVRRVLSIDRLSRIIGIEDDLFPFDEVALFIGQSKWLDPLPTVYNSTHVYYRDRSIDEFKGIMNQSFAKCQKNLLEKYPALKVFNWDNMLVAGGAVSEAICENNNNYRSYSHDCDIFLYGLTPEQCDLKVQEILDHIHATHKTSGASYQFNAIKTANALTVYMGRWTSIAYQIIFRAYNTKSEILHGFDLGSCAVGYDGNTIHFTTLSTFAYAYRKNIVDTTRRSLNYEYRLLKYLGRGFEVILPGLKNQYSGKPKIDLHHFRLTHCRGNQFVVNDPGHWSGQISDYQTINIINTNHPRNSIFGHNLQQMSADPKYKQFFGYFDDPKKWNTNQINVVPTGAIKYYYLKRETAILTTYMSRQFKQLFGKDALKSYIIMQIDGASRKEKEALLESLESQLQKTEWVIQENENLRHTKWVTKNPGSQTVLTSSFNPVMKNPRNWYKTNYKPFYLYLDWSIMRLLWISKYKGGGAFDRVPKDVIGLIIKACVEN